MLKLYRKLVNKLNELKKDVSNLHTVYKFLIIACTLTVFLVVALGLFISYHNLENFIEVEDQLRLYYLYLSRQSSYKSYTEFRFVLKFIMCIALLVFVRGGIPRFRYDYLSKMG